MISIKSTHPWANSARTKAGLAALLAATLAWTSPGASAQTATANTLPQVRLQAGMHFIQAEMAATAQQRETGLMNRPSMPANAGMLFAFDGKAYHCFWMKNTLIPLSIAFLDDDGRIVSISDMAPMTEESHCPSAPVRYALEMNKGWFAKKGLGEGQRISGEPFRPR